MILGFSTQLNGKPTYFVERIHSCLILNDLMDGFNADFANVDFSMDAFAEKNMKFHTIRDDKNDRWKVGTKIDFFINCRQSSMFRFAPVLPVVSIQKVEIVWDKVFGKYLYPDVFIDNSRLHPERLEEIAQNDGFDTIDDFFAYFDKDFRGKIIHWTTLRY